jgi:hypothetical protein
VERYHRKVCCSFQRACCRCLPDQVSFSVSNKNKRIFQLSVISCLTKLFLCSWSADSRLLLSGSKDSTLKVLCILFHFSLTFQLWFDTNFLFASVCIVFLIAWYSFKCITWSHNLAWAVMENYHKTCILTGLGKPLDLPSSICCMLMHPVCVSDSGLGYSNAQVETGPTGPRGWGTSELLGSINLSSLVHYTVIYRRKKRDYVICWWTRTL